MAIKIDKNIVGYKVKKDEASPDKDVKEPEQKVDNVVQMHERLERPERLCAPSAGAGALSPRPFNGARPAAHCDIGGERAPVQVYCTVQYNTVPTRYD